MNSFNFETFFVTVTYVLFIALVADSTIIRSTNTPMTLPPEACGTETSMRDQCFDFTDFLDGNVQASTNPNLYIACNNGAPMCMPCPGSLFYSNKCQSCEFEIDDSLNNCPKIQRSEAVTGTPLPKPDCSIETDAGFCSARSDGNYAHPTLRYCYYACNGGMTHPMACSTMNLVYDSACDACVFKHMAGQDHNGGNNNGKKK